MTMKERVAALKARFGSLLPSSESLGLIQSRGGRRAVLAVLGSYAARFGSLHLLEHSA